MELLAQFHGIAADPAQLIHQYGQCGQPFTETELLLVAKSLELKACTICQPIGRLAHAALPALALSQTGSISSSRGWIRDKVLIHDLKQGKPVVLDMASSGGTVYGRLLVVASRASVAASLAL
ncbi:type I secretion system permease/ATPase, partial [Paludibacterium sp. dN 18-1]